MPQDGAIQIAVDRYLLPASVSRQSVLVLETSGQPIGPALTPNVIYDPVARTVTLTRPRPGPWLAPGQPYRLRFTVPQDGADTTGLRAIDRAPLSTAQPLEYVFFVDAAPPPAPRSVLGALGEPEGVSFCDDVLPIFARKCSGGTCHGSSPQAAAAAGLVLDTREGLRATAINRVAHGATSGGASNAPPSEGPVFGVDMPIIAVDERLSPPVGVPGNSWLLYKIELAPPPVVDAGAPAPFGCTGAEDDTPRQATPFAGLVPAAPAGDLERSILSDFVPGREMPYPPFGARAYVNQPLTFQERETVRMWIARGAQTPSCGVCQ